jgi:hypothetical protein
MVCFQYVSLTDPRDGKDLPAVPREVCQQTQMLPFPGESCPMGVRSHEDPCFTTVARVAKRRHFFPKNGSLV